MSCKRFQKIAPSLLMFFAIIFCFSKLQFEPEDTTTDGLYLPVIVCYTDKDLRTDGSRVWWLKSSRINCSKERQCDVKSLSEYKETADAYVFYASFIESLPLPRDPTILWGIIYVDTPRDVLRILHEKTLNLFNFSSTFSRYSTVPLTLYWVMPNLLTDLKYYQNTSRKNLYRSEIAPILYMQSDCETFTNRDEYVTKLMEYIPVDSYGFCVNNRRFPPIMDHFSPDSKDYLSHLYAEQIMEFIARYKFVIAIENAVCNDYVTEKLWRTLSVGSVPIYFGDPLIRDWLPNKKSAILLQDYPTPKLLSDHLYALLANDTKYEEYLEHKTKGMISNENLLREFSERPFQNDLMLQIEKLYCKMCERLHDGDTNQTDIVTKKHLNCSMPISALTLSENPENSFVRRIEEAKRSIERLY